MVHIHLQATVRTAAKEIGMRAIKQAGAAEQRETALMQQRKSFRQPLASREDLRAAAVAVANGWALPPVTGQCCCQAINQLQLQSLGPTEGQQPVKPSVQSHGKRQASPGCALLSNCSRMLMLSGHVGLPVGTASSLTGSSMTCLQVFISHCCSCCPAHGLGTQDVNIWTQHAVSSICTCVHARHRLHDSTQVQHSR